MQFGPLLAGLSLQALKHPRKPTLPRSLSYSPFPPHTGPAAGSTSQPTSSLPLGPDSHALTTITTDLAAFHPFTPRSQDYAVERVMRLRAMVRALVQKMDTTLAGECKLEKWAEDVADIYVSVDVFTC